MYVYHDSAFYNCCSLFRFNLEANGTVLDFIEVDTAGALCDCLCYFDLSSLTTGLSRGTYTARLWTQDRQTLLGEAEAYVPGRDVVWFETSCDTLIVHHDGRLANCCSKIVFAFQQQENLLSFTERDTASVLCKCMCNFDLTAWAYGPAEGQYTVQLWDGDVDTLWGSGVVLITPCSRR